MNNTALRIGIAAAVVVVAAAIGISQLAGRGTGGPTPTATPTPGASPVSLDAGYIGVPLDGGRLTFGIGQPSTGGGIAVELTTQGGWVLEELRAEAVTFAGPTQNGAWLGFYRIKDVYQDPCHPEDGFNAMGGLGHRDAVDIVDGLRTLAGFEAGPANAVRVGGRMATHFVISNTIDTDAAACTDGALLPLFVTWNANMAAELRTRTDASPATNGGTSQEIWIVGASNPLVIVGEVGRADPDAGRAALQEIVDTIRLSD